MVQHCPIDVGLTSPLYATASYRIDVGFWHQADILLAESDVSF